MAKTSPVKYKKAPQAPRRFKSAYMFFSTEKHKSIRRDLQEQDQAAEKIPTTHIAKMVSAAWKALPTDERDKFEELARRDKARYEVERNTYTGPWKIPATRRLPKDPRAPKRPMSAFLAFSNVRRPAVKLVHPHIGSTEMSRILAQMWKDAPHDERMIFTRKEQALRAEYKAKATVWREQAETARISARQVREDEAHRIADAEQNNPNGVPEPSNMLVTGLYADHVDVSSFYNQYGQYIHHHLAGSPTVHPTTAAAAAAAADRMHSPVTAPTIPAARTHSPTKTQTQRRSSPPVERSPRSSPPTKADHTNSPPTTTTTRTAPDEHMHSQRSPPPAPPQYYQHPPSSSYASTAAAAYTTNTNTSAPHYEQPASPKSAMPMDPATQSQPPPASPYRHHPYYGEDGSYKHDQYPQYPAYHYPPPPPGYYPPPGSHGYGPPPSHVPYYPADSRGEGNGASNNHTYYPEETNAEMQNREGNEETSHPPQHPPYPFCPPNYYYPHNMYYDGYYGHNNGAPPTSAQSPASMVSPTLSVTSTASSKPNNSTVPSSNDRS